MSAAPAEVLVRAEAIEGTIHWAHTEVAIELRVALTADGRAAVTATVLYYGNYWDNWPAPQTRSLALAGVARSEAANRLTIAIDPPAPIDALAIDPTRPRIEALFVGVGGPPTEPLPAWFMPLVAWARGEGLAVTVPS